MLTVWLLVAPARADWPLGADIPGAVTADVTPEGLDAVTAIIPGLVPADIPVPDQHFYDEECFIFCVELYDVDFTNGVVHLAVTSFDITPGTGVLNLTATLQVSLNDPNDPAYLHAEALGFIGDTCDVWVDPIDIGLNAAIELTLYDSDGDGTNDAVDAYMPVPTWGWSFSEDDLVFDNCTSADIIDVIDFLGFWDDIIDPVQAEIESQIDAIVADLPATVEPALEDAFSSIEAIEGSVDLLGAPLDYRLVPSELTIVPDGVRIGMSSSFDTTPHPCVAQYGITESLATTGVAPPVGAWPDVITYTPHLVIGADDDMVNQALFAVWQSGILCQTIDESAASELGLPIGIDTGLLDLLAPGVYEGLFEDGAPLVLAVVPKLPPVASPQGQYDLNVGMDELGIDFLGELDGRMVRIVGVDLEVEAGADLTFDGTSGLLSILVQLGEDAITPSIGFNELKPDASETIVTSFGNLFNTLVGPLLTSALGDLSFPMPAFLGYGITALDIAPTGNLDLDPSGGQGDHIGLYGTIGPVTYTATGCGCDSEDPYASTTCGTTGGGTSFLGLGVAALVLRRRRPVTRA